MKIDISQASEEMGRKAAAWGVESIRAALENRGAANIILATGASQFTMLEALVATSGIQWQNVSCFHLDEYVGMPISHGASFRKYLKERFLDQLSVKPKKFEFIDAENDATAECQRLGDVIQQFPIDVAFIGIGENGHLAFNDPPADFETEEPYLVVELDEACRRQQLGEGWFATFEDVPQHAISMSVKQIMKSNRIVCTVPDERKAIAVRNAIQGDVTPDCPASILQRHQDVTLFLDEAAAAKLK